MKSTFLLYILILSNYAFGAPIGFDISPDFFKNNLESIFLIWWVALASYIMVYRKEDHDAVGLTVIMTISLISFYFFIK